MESDAEKFLVTHDRGYLEKFMASTRVFGGALATLDSTSMSAPEASARAALVAAWRATESHATNLAKVATMNAEAGHASVAQLQESLERVGAEDAPPGTRVAGCNDGRGEAGRRVRRSLRNAFRGSPRSLRLALSALLSALLVRSIVDPLGRLAEGTREVSAGRFGHRLEAGGSDELAQVARDFNSMTGRLDELDRMKREFVAKVSHDLKTPLSSMQETISVMLDDLAGPLTPKQRRMLELNLESGQRLSAMLTKLLDLSRIEAGLEPDFQMLDVATLVSLSVERMSAAGMQRSVRLTFAEPPGRILVRGDSLSLSQVLDNLIENAVKYSPPAGAVHVSVSDGATSNSGLRGGALVIRVSDEGAGIPDEEKARVFSQFYQTETGRGVTSRGVGLGLTICKEIVDAHGGEIWVEDNEPRGSIFCVKLNGAVRGAGAHDRHGDIVRMMPRLLCFGCIVALGACASAPFDRFVEQGRWSDAARAFSADSSLLNSEHALYTAGVFHGTPARPTYDLERARTLLRLFLSRFPESGHRGDASDRLSMLDEVARMRDSSGARARVVESRVAELTAEVQRLHAVIDSMVTIGDGVRRSTVRLESDLRERDEQLRALRLELRQLKEIDLKPRVPCSSSVGPS